MYSCDLTNYVSIFSADACTYAQMWDELASDAFWLVLKMIVNSRYMYAYYQLFSLLVYNSDMDGFVLQFEMCIDLWWCLFVLGKSLAICRTFIKFLQTAPADRFILFCFLAPADMMRWQKCFKLQASVNKRALYKFFMVIPPLWYACELINRCTAVSYTHLTLPTIDDV